MASLLERSGHDVELVLEPGAHDWRYWRTSAVETLAWHARQFPPPPRPDDP
jgi:S-formylglutathione hydrolase FrmB